MILLDHGGSWESVGAAVTDLDGSFEVKRIRPVARKLVAQVWRAGGTYVSEPFVIDEPRVVGGFEMRLEAPMRVEGVVVDARGDPVPGVKLELFDTTPEEMWRGAERTVFSDANGRFAMRVLDADGYELRAERADGRALAAPVPFEIGGSGTPLQLEVRLHPDAPLGR